MFSNITDNVPLPFSCAVCGKSLNPILQGMPDFAGDGSTKCKSCNRKVCNGCYDKKKGKCQGCTGKKDWCTTPPSLP